jgi:hypothetical protein
MAKGFKTGGRRAGTPNKRTVALTAALAERLEEMNFCPVEALIRVGQAAEASGELDLARAAFADVAPFIYPRKKAVEHAGGLGLEQLVTYSVVTGVPRSPNDPLPEAPAAPVRAAPERAEAAHPPMPAPEPTSAPAPAAARPAAPPRITVMHRAAEHPGAVPYVAEPVPAGGDATDYDPFAP